MNAVRFASPGLRKIPSGLWDARAEARSASRDLCGKEKFSVGRAAPSQFGRFALLPIMELKPDPSNPRKHGREQIRAIARSIAAFGFNAPIMIDRNRQIVAGHGRYEAASLLGLAQVPVIFLDHLTETQAKAYRLADNKLTDRSSWDDAKVAAQLKELSEPVLDFDIE